MENTAYRSAASVALGAALTFAIVGVVMGDGDPEVMSLVMLPLILIGAIAYTVRNEHDGAYRAAVGVALAAGFILFWMIGAVGVMATGDEHPNDLFFVVVPIVGSIGAMIARFQPGGMARALFATALAQLLVPAAVVLAGLNLVPISVAELIWFTLVANGPFAALFVGSALLFRKAARSRAPAGAAL